MRKKVLSWLGTLLVLAGTLLPAVNALAEQVENTPDSGAWNLTSSGPAYANGNTTWEYTLVRTGFPSELSLLDLVLCNAFNAATVEASHGGVVGSNDSLGLPNVVEWEASQLRTVTQVRVTYTGLWATGLQSWYIQAGQDLYEGTVNGPTCEPLQPDFSVSKTVSIESDPSTGQSSLTLTGGGTVYYFHTITNTGNTRLTIDSAVDDQLGEIPFPPEDLAPGDWVTVTSEPISFPDLAPGSPPQTLVTTLTVMGSYAGQSVGPKSAQATVINQAPPGRASFTVEKRVSATNDAGAAQESITLDGGGTAYYFYTIRNTGDVPLTIESAHDDQLPHALTFTPVTVAPGGTAEASEMKHFAPPLPGSEPITEVNTVFVIMGHQGETIGPATDTASVTVTAPEAEPRFSVSNTVSDQDDRATGQESLTLTGGGTAYWFYTIHNTGNVPLTISDATDDLAGAIDWDRQTLGPDEEARAWVVQQFAPPAPGAAPETLSNTLAVSMDYAGSVIGPQSDSATVTNEPAPRRGTGSFTVEKLVTAENDESTGTDAITLEGGGTAYYFFTITNNGDLPLHIDSAVDDVLGALALDETDLAPWESATATSSKSFAGLAPGSSDQVETNTVTVTTTFSDGTSATESDQATVTNRAVPANPDFTITKLVSRTNNPATASDSITLTGGGTAYYFYTVENTGNVPLTITEAVDDVLGAVTFTPTVVEVGETATALASKTFPSLSSGTPEQTETNTVAVTVAHTGANRLSKSAQATVINRAPSGGGCCTLPPAPVTNLTVEKLASTVNDPATGQALLTLTGGGTVYYFYTVRNTGQTVLTVESATDDKLGNLVFSPAAIRPGESAKAVSEKVFAALPPGTATQNETNTVSLSVRDQYGVLHGPITAQATVVNEAEAARGDFSVTKQVSLSADPEKAQSSLTLPAEGGTVFFLYTVTNTGNVPLTIAEAVDDKLGPVPFSPSVVPVGGTATATLTKQFEPGDAGQTETNVVTVRATHGEVAVGPKTDLASVQVAAKPVGSLEVRVMDGSTRNTGVFPYIPGATVTLSNGVAGTTDSSGRVIFTGLPLGLYEVTAAAVDPQNPLPETQTSGSGSVTLSQTSPDEVLTIVLAWEPVSGPTSRPSISVAVCQSFAELGGEVTAVGPDGVAARGVLQDDGTYLLSNLAAGTWTVSLTAPGLTEPATRTLGLRSDYAVPENAYRLDLSGVCPTRLGSLAGRVCSPKQPGAEIRGQGPNGESASVTIPSSGKLGEWREYRLTNLIPGQWKLTLQTSGSEPVSQTVTVASGQITEVPDFTLACTGQSALDVTSTWYYLLGGLLVVAGITLRRWARAC